MSADIVPLATEKPDRKAAEEAVRTILAYYGEDPSRPGLLDTPKRFVDAYAEFLAGYMQDPVEILSRTFDDVVGYDDIVLMKNIRFDSHCEHHIQPMIGTAHVGYLPAQKVVGISKLARVVDIYAHRLQSQETLTNQIADAIEEALAPRGVAVLVEAEHQCITTRGIHKEGASCVTRRLTGAFREDKALAANFFDLIRA
ncbi:MAG: GTP cyclohydrolase I FolE [Pseudomonadota bacterium]